jgi:hypothetical protein
MRPRLHEEAAMRIEILFALFLMALGAAAQAARKSTLAHGQRRARIFVENHDLPLSTSAWISTPATAAGPEKSGLAAMTGACCPRRG